MSCTISSPDKKSLKYLWWSSFKHSAIACRVFHSFTSCSHLSTSRRKYLWTGENLAELHYEPLKLIVENYHLIPLLYTCTTTILN
jgi:hypothetical protein